jgi:protein associated with RNAse G/E
MIKPNGISYYCNLASPCVIEKACVTYIDYDLDVKLFQDKRIRLLDEKEYEVHRQKYNYGEDLDKILRYQTNKVVRMMEQNEFPFSDDKITQYYDQLLKYFTKG